MVSPAIRRYLRSNPIIKSVFSNSQLGVVITNKRHEVVDANERFCSLYGVGVEKIIGSSIFTKNDIAYNSEKFEAFNNILKIGTPISVEFQEQVEGQSGKMELSYSLSLLEMENEIFTIALVSDITSTLRERNKIIAEIHHRVKNNLALMSALLTLQEHYISNGELRKILSESNYRLLSIAEIHELVYKAESFQQVQVCEYSRKLCERLIMSYISDASTVKSTITGCNVYVDLNKAVTLALLLNELITNSLKHAYEEDKENEISIHFLQNGNYFEFVYQDSGTKPFDLSQHNQSFGVILIQTLLKQLGAEYTSESKKGFRLQAKFSN